jgi:hypothetical protein
MKRSLLLLATVAAAIGLMAPAAASAVTIGVYPAGHKFEVTPTSQIKGSLAGSCTFGKITGQVPAAPANVGESISLPIPAPTATCSGGPTIAIAGTEWKINLGAGYSAALRVPANGITLRYASLPGCKLSNPNPWLTAGWWRNGYPSPFLSRSGWNLEGVLNATWANDGATCAMAGKTELVDIAPPTRGSASPVTDTTLPSTFIGVGVGF